MYASSGDIDHGINSGNCFCNTDLYTCDQARISFLQSSTFKVPEDRAQHMLLLELPIVNAVALFAIFAPTCIVFIARCSRYELKDSSLSTVSTECRHKDFLVAVRESAWLPVQIGFVSFPSFRKVCQIVGRQAEQHTVPRSFRIIRRFFDFKKVNKTSEVGTSVVAVSPAGSCQISLRESMFFPAPIHQSSSKSTILRTLTTFPIDLVTSPDSMLLKSPR